MPSSSRASLSPRAPREASRGLCGSGGHPISFQSFGQLSRFFFGSLEKEAICKTRRQPAVDCSD